MLLRIEDTDPERSTDENIEVICDAMAWLGIDWDQEPVSQTSRRPRHEEAVKQILDAGAGYLDDGAVRVRVGEGDDIVFDDVIRGQVRNPRSAIKDFVIARSDGSPLYNLAVAVDDHDMGVTHVIRGEDHLSNTARQVLILEALGHERPVYAHLPLLLGPDGKKLSKRYDAASVQWLREQGYLAEAVVNYLALLGWGYDDSTTFFTRDELVEHFALERVSKNPAVFDEAKLRWMNGHYLRELGAEDLKARIEAFLGRSDVPLEAVQISQEKMQTLADFWPLAGFLVERQETDPKAWAKVMGDGAAERLEQARDALAGLRRLRRRAGRDCPARSGRAGGCQAEGGLPAGARGAGRDHDFAGHLRIRGRAGAGRDPDPDRRRPCASASARLNTSPGSADR